MRCSRSTAVRFAAALAAGLLWQAAGKADPPVVVIRTTPFDLKSTAKPEAGVGALNLLPNADVAYYAYVHNPNKDEVDLNITVVLSADADGKDVIGTAKVVGLKDSSTIPLAFAAAPTKATPPAPPAKNPDGTLAPAKPDLGLALPSVFYLAVIDDKTGEPYKGFAGQTYSVNVDPTKFVSASATITKDGDSTNVLVKLAQPGGKALLPKESPGLKVKLDIRPQLIYGLEANPVSEGTYETVFTSDSGTVILEAKNLKILGDGKDKIRKVAIAVNDFERAFMFDISTAGSDASPDTEPFVRLDVPRYAVPGKPFFARIENYKTSDPKPGDGSKYPRLTFQRTDEGDKELLTRTTYDPKAINSREVKLFAKFEALGKISLSTTVKDWVIPVRTDGVYGKRTFELFGDEKNKDVPRVVIFDDTPPVVVADGIKAILPAPKPKKKDAAKAPLPPEFFAFSDKGEPAPARIAKGEVLRIAAQAEDKQQAAGDDLKVLFFLGDPPTADGKPAPGGKVEEGRKKSEIKLNPSAKKTAIVPPSAFKGDWYEAEFDTSELPKGKHKIGVRFVNGAGLSATVTRDVIVFEPPAPRVLGDIKVTVTAGYDPERPQPGLTVTALADGKPVAAGKTSPQGVYTFKDLKPGAYTIFAVKSADGNARAFSVVTVIADDEVETSMSLKR